MCSVASGTRSLSKGYGDRKMLVVPESISPPVRRNSPCRSRIWTSCTMYDESGLTIPHKYLLDRTAFEISKTMLSLSESNAVEFPLMLPTMPHYQMTAIQAYVRPSSPSELYTEIGRLVFGFLTIEGVLVFNLFSISWRSMVFEGVGTWIFRALECCIFG